MRLVSRLHERANRAWIAAQQSRRLAVERRGDPWLGLRLRTIPEGPPAVIETVEQMVRYGAPREHRTSPSDQLPGDR
jgi:hypothetical protein